MIPMTRPKNTSKQRGATLYEFAAILPILLFMMIGIVDFGRAMYMYHFVASAASQAARWASVRGVNCKAYTSGCPAINTDIQTYILGTGNCQGGVAAQLGGVPMNCTTGCSTATVGCLHVNTTSSFIWPGTTTTSGSNTADCTSGGTYPVNSPGCIVQVQVSYTWSPQIPLLPYTIVLAQTSSFVISN
jgi:Flp pilus assembly protein TadG